MAEELQKLQKSRSGNRTKNGSSSDESESDEGSDESRISVSDLFQLEANMEDEQVMECVD